MRLRASSGAIVSIAVLLLASASIAACSVDVTSTPPVPPANGDAGTGDAASDASAIEADANGAKTDASTGDAAFTDGSSNDATAPLHDAGTTDDAALDGSIDGHHRWEAIVTPSVGANPRAPYVLTLEGDAVRIGATRGDGAATVLVNALGAVATKLPGAPAGNPAIVGRADDGALVGAVVPLTAPHSATNPLGFRTWDSDGALTSSNAATPPLALVGFYANPSTTVFDPSTGGFVVAVTTRPSPTGDEENALIGYDRSGAERFHTSLDWFAQRQLVRLDDGTYALLELTGTAQVTTFAKDGTKRWSTQLTAGSAATTIATAGDHIALYRTNQLGRVQSTTLAAADGAIESDFTLPDWAKYAAPIASGDIAVTSSHFATTLVAKLDAHGNEMWRSFVVAPTSTVTAIKADAAGHVFVAGYDPANLGNVFVSAFGD